MQASESLRYGAELFIETAVEGTFLSGTSADRLFWLAVSVWLSYGRYQDFLGAWPPIMTFTKSEKVLQAILNNLGR